MKEKTLRAAYQRPEAEIFLLELGTSVLDNTSPGGSGNGSGQIPEFEFLGDD